jgi:hypothetical protein
MSSVYLRDHTLPYWQNNVDAESIFEATPPDGSPGFPDDVVTVTRDQWRDRFYADVKVKEPAVTDNTLRQRLSRARTELIDAEKVDATGERCWITAT